MKLTIGELLDITVDRYPQHDALVYPPHQELRYTYKEFQRRCNQVAKGLMALGIERGEHIAIMAPQSPGVGFTPICRCQDRGGIGNH